MVKKSATDSFRTASKRAIQKIAEANGDFIGRKLLKKFKKFQKIHNKIIHTKLQMRIIKEHLKNT